MKRALPFIASIGQRFARRGGAPRPLVHPVREWGVSIIVTVLAALCLFSYAGIDFYLQYTDSNFPEVSEESIPRYRESDAQFLIRAYDGRADAFRTLRNDRPLIAESAPLPMVEVEPEATTTAEAVVAGDRVAE